MENRMRRIARTSLMLTALLAMGASCKKGGSVSPNQAAKQLSEADRTKAKEEAKAQGLIELANDALKKGRYVTAREQAKQALEANPENADAYAVLGAAEWRAGNFVGSTEAYEKAVEKDGENFGALLGLARNRQAQGNHPDAITLADRVIASENKGWTPKACGEGNTCEEGWCDTRENQCKAPMQIDPRLTKLWAYLLTLDVDAARETIDEINLGVGGDKEQLGIVAGYRSYVAALEGKGPFIEIEGTSTTSDLQVDMSQGFKHVSATAGGEYARTVLFDLADESRIHADLAKTLKLKEVAKFKPVGMAEEQALVIIPEIKIGKGVTIKNVPAFVQDLTALESQIGEVPGLLLGRQALYKFGAISYDFPGNTVELSVEAPGSAPDGAADVPLLMLDLRVKQIPAVEISVDGSEHTFWAWLGGIYKSGVTVTSKDYLKSKHRPSEIDPPDDPNQGLKMVYVDTVKVGDVETAGAGGLVLTNTPPDAGLKEVVEGSAFSLGGYLNFALVRNWKVTFLFSQGRVWIEPAKAEAPPAEG
jgi:tetratricopeptide (TPR) repeat protein